MYVSEDAYYDENHTLSGTDDYGNSVTFEPDSSGDYIRRTDSGGYDCIEDSDGRTIAYVH